MDIHLHIERLILDGLPLPLEGQAVLQAALEAELARLLVAGGLPGAGELPETWRSGRAIPYLRAGGIRLGSESGPEQLGQQIAQAVYESVGR
jgi:hypothetical protein